MTDRRNWSKQDDISQGDLDSFLWKKISKIYDFKVDQKLHMESQDNVTFQKASIILSCMDRVSNEGKGKKRSDFNVNQ